MSNRKKATTAPGDLNPHGSFEYDSQRVEDLGYQEGFTYALTWTPGRPVPAAVTSSAQTGHKYNAEYVAGYRSGIADGIASRDENIQDEWAVESAGTRQLLPGATARKKSTMANNRKRVARRRTASEWNRNLNELDQTPSDQDWWGEHNGEAGHGAANVANVPTPGADNGYPQPQDVDQDSAVAEEAAQEWQGAEVMDLDKVEAFQKRVLANLRREAAANANRRRSARRVHADYKSTMQKGKRLRDSGQIRVLDLDTDTIDAQVLGDTGAYDVYLHFEDGSRRIDGWSCTCPYFVRNGQGKTCAHLCSHAYATYYEWQGQKGYRTADAPEPIVTEAGHRFALKNAARMRSIVARKQAARRNAPRRAR